MIGSLWNNPGEWAATHAEALLRIVLIPLAAWGLTRLLRALIRRLERLVEARGNDSASEQQKRARTIARVLSQMSGILVWSVAAMLVLSELGVNLGPILAGAGIAGLAVGFGAQTLVKDLISGFFLLFENQVRVNDVVTVGDVSGVVEAINLRTTVLRDTDGRVHIVPNGAINVVTNHTRAGPGPCWTSACPITRTPTVVSPSCGRWERAWRGTPSSAPGSAGPSSIPESNAWTPPRWCSG